MRPPTLRFIVPCLGAALLILASAGCTVVRFKSSPPGAAIELSQTGGQPWQTLQSGSGDDAAPRATPFWTLRPLSGYAFVRARLDGHLPTERQLVDFSGWGWRTLSFELAPSRELIAQQNRAAGLVWFGEAWVDPTVEGLVEREGRWMTAEDGLVFDQRRAGMVLVEGEWIPEEVARVRERERKVAQGYVDYKGRLLPPNEVQHLTSIDLQVADLGARGDVSHEGGGLFELTGQTAEGGQLKLFNATSLEVEFLISGPFSHSASLQPYHEATVALPPGSYRIAALPITPGVYDPFLGAYEIDPQGTYTFTYLGIDIGVRGSDEVLEGNALDIEAPVIEIPAFTPPAKVEGEEAGGGGGGEGGRRRGGGGGGRGGRPPGGGRG